MSVTGFNRRRRELAKRAEFERLKAEQEAKEKTEQKKEADAECQEATAQSKKQTPTSQDASTPKAGSKQSPVTKKKPSSKQQEK